MLLENAKSKGIRIPLITPDVSTLSKDFKKPIAF